MWRSLCGVCVCVTRVCVSLYTWNKTKAPEPALVPVFLSAASLPLTHPLFPTLTLSLSHTYSLFSSALLSPSLCRAQSRTKNLKLNIFAVYISCQQIVCAAHCACCHCCCCCCSFWSAACCCTVHRNLLAAEFGQLRCANARYNDTKGLNAAS